MSEAKHTPGPWDIRDTILSGRRGVYGQIGLIAVLAEHDIGAVEWEQGDANARLIAAAPEMLAALQLCLPYLPEGIGIRAAAAEAIAKATN